MANTTNDTILGSDLILMVFDGTEYKPLAHATSHSLEVSRESRSISSKSTGDFNAADYGKYTWSGSADALVSYDTDKVSFDTLLDMQIARTKIKIVSIPLGTGPADDTGATTPIADAAGLKESSPTSVENASTFKLGATYRYGEAVLTSVSLSAGGDDSASYSISFSGATPLTKATVAADV